MNHFRNFILLFMTLVFKASVTSSLRCVQCSSQLDPDCELRPPPPTECPGREAYCLRATSYLLKESRSIFDVDANTYHDEDNKSGGGGGGGGSWRRRRRRRSGLKSKQTMQPAKDNNEGEKLDEASTNQTVFRRDLSRYSSSSTSVGKQDAENESRIRLLFLVRTCVNDHSGDGCREGRSSNEGAEFGRRVEFCSYHCRGHGCNGAAALQFPKLMASIITIMVVFNSIRHNI